MVYKDGIYIGNLDKVIKAFQYLDISNSPEIRRGAAKVIRVPFLKIRRMSRRNLKAQKSIMTSNLYRGLTVRQKSSKRKGNLSIAFGAAVSKIANKSQKFKFGRYATAKGKVRKAVKIKGATNHFHFVNTGTKQRRTKKGYNRGAVGRAKTTWEGRNTLFKLKFADRAIGAVYNTFSRDVTKGLAIVYTEAIKKIRT